MSKLVHVVVAAACALAFTSHAYAQQPKKGPGMKPYTAQERLVFDRASANTGGASGGDAGGGSSQ